MALVPESKVRSVVCMPASSRFLKIVMLLMHTYAESDMIEASVLFLNDSCKVYTML